ncbi:uncharacterized protein RSE6_05452 [Rhynchosporium secalis]|uniref:Uncharacterized protein n=1 Tax=Rhynchosporium secalis TaxID=38038 RepID=A0A1E1M919_RHYSE|nr:uncharacterized protein RSE6_05452 [Rhynchosporium secalis]
MSQLSSISMENMLAIGFDAAGTRSEMDAFANKKPFKQENESQ